jgi:hypothetical protein
MPLEPGFARRVHRIRQEEHPAVDGEHDRDEADQGGGDATRSQHRLRHGHVGDGPEAHVEEELPVGSGARVLDEDADSNGEHHAGHGEEGAEVVQEHPPRERLWRDLEGGPRPCPFHLVADGRRGGVQARMENDRRATVHLDDAVTPLRGQPRFGGEDAHIRRNEESGIRSPHTRRKGAEQHREGCHRQRDHDERARFPPHHCHQITRAGAPSGAHDEHAQNPLDSGWARISHRATMDTPPDYREAPSEIE